MQRSAQDILADQAPADSSKVPGILLAYFCADNYVRPVESFLWFQCCNLAPWCISGRSLPSTRTEYARPSTSMNTDKKYKTCSFASSCSGLSPSCAGAARGECASEHSSNCPRALTQAATWLPMQWAFRTRRSVFGYGHIAPGAVGAWKCRQSVFVPVFLTVQTSQKLLQVCASMPNRFEDANGTSVGTCNALETLRFKTNPSQERSAGKEEPNCLKALSELTGVQNRPKVLISRTQT